MENYDDGDWWNMANNTFGGGKLSNVSVWSQKYMGENFFEKVGKK